MPENPVQWHSSASFVLVVEKETVKKWNLF